jgi:hypothetical protein
VVPQRVFDDVDADAWSMPPPPRTSAAVAPTADQRILFVRLRMSISRG